LTLSKLYAIMREKMVYSVYQTENTRNTEQDII
jgi:hypothetical protein